MRGTITFLVVIALLGLAAGCAGTNAVKTPSAPQTAQILGESEGGGGSFLLFGCIPIAHNDRLQRATNEAIQRKGGSAIVNPVVTERWFWTPAGNGFITTVRGTVVK